MEDWLEELDEKIIFLKKIKSIVIVYSTIDFEDCDKVRDLKDTLPRYPKSFTTLDKKELLKYFISKGLYDFYEEIQYGPDRYNTDRRNWAHLANFMKR